MVPPILTEDDVPKELPERVRGKLPIVGPVVGEIEAKMGAL